MVCARSSAKTPGRRTLLLKCSGLCVAVLLQGCVEPKGILAVAFNETARREILKLAEPGSRLPRVNTPVVRWGKWTLTSGFRLQEENDDYGGLTERKERVGSRTKFRVRADCVYGEIEWRF